MAVGRRVLVAALGGATAAWGAEWYSDIDSITVLNPGDDASKNQQMVDAIWKAHEEDATGNPDAFQKGQFGVKRRAILLRSGDYGDLHLPVNWYTSVMGTGMSPEDVVVKGFSSIDAYPGSKKGALENFWRSVEGLTTKEDTTMWAVSQAAPLRRCRIAGDLRLAETDNSTDNPKGTHYTSGGFMADVVVDGSLHWGSQQQFFFRNSKMNKVDYQASGQSMVFVGVEGAPDYDKANKPKPLISNIGQSPGVAEKPYLAEHNGEWNIVVPKFRKETRGVSWQEGLWQPLYRRLVPLKDVCVARAGDSADDIQKCMAGKRGLLLTPGIYGLDKPLNVYDEGFVVLGIGMPTLVATKGLSAIIVHPGAKKARVSQILLEAGTPDMVDATMPLLWWKADKGHISSLFARVGAFSYETSFHKSCSVTKADVMTVIDGRQVVVDNAWLWHADHDDCTEDGKQPASDACSTTHGLVVNGDDVTSYGAAVEHTKKDLLVWNGENGKLFFFQSELPYGSNLDFGKEGNVGYRVAYGVEKHEAYGVGVYQVFGTYTLDVSIRLPAGAQVTNMFSWCITGNRTTLGRLACTAPGLSSCLDGDCDANSCQTYNFGPSGNSLRPQPSAAIVV
eukprot:TRINITY_DN82276_c0_g1_i1.p1 TRINITY_DN82276_c0_g1~~TRINITY_DN82276_c0_g1_i1.p1  ORF type:complete len:635 (-),score=148.10 TRINITY_DN82276_c0_g1_i1:170-2026(-)